MEWNHSPFPTKPPFQQPPSTSSPLPPNPRHVTVIIQSMKSSLPQRITKSIQLSLNIRSNHNLNVFNSIMNDSGDDKKEVKSCNDTKEPVKVPEKLPEPPEKPLAGDCCGSGCVRCVWDVYYDELEEYNKIVKDVTDSASSKAS
ncbi:oxidoreductase-like protein [Tanacetum coccineum]